MNRRKFVKNGIVGAAVTSVVGITAPAIAQDVRKWTMVTAWPKNLPGPGVAAQMLADRITALSGGGSTGSDQIRLLKSKPYMLFQTCKFTLILSFW